MSGKSLAFRAAAVGSERRGWAICPCGAGSWGGVYKRSAAAIFPKGSYFSDISDDDLQNIVVLINNRPRKRLNYLTLFEVLKKFSRNCVEIVLAIYHQIMLLTSKQCMSFFCTKNVRLSDDIESPEITRISGVILFGKAFGKLCSGKGRFMRSTGS